jgi:hypothetical protein
MNMVELSNKLRGRQTPLPSRPENLRLLLATGAIQWL